MKLFFISISCARKEIPISIKREKIDFIFSYYAISLGNFYANCS